MINNKTTKLNPKLETGWLNRLEGEFQKDYLMKIKEHLLDNKKKGLITYPQSSKIFSAFDLCPFDKVKVVIIGQDPYHGPGQAHGLCFSVQKGIKFPPSLLNIFKELETDINMTLPSNGDLTEWAKQGVFLLNSSLTVLQAKPGSHFSFGWEIFTDAAIQAINDYKKDVVFLLWGSFAQKKSNIIDSRKHLILKAPHPSPLSAHRGFFGCRHFSKANKFFVSKGKKPINWDCLN